MKDKDYSKTEELRNILHKLKGRKFVLDCGHHVTFGHSLGNNVMVYNGKKFEVVCSLCSY